MFKSCFNFNVAIAERNDSMIYGAWFNNIASYAECHLWRKCAEYEHQECVSPQIYDMSEP